MDLEDIIILESPFEEIYEEVKMEEIGQNNENEDVIQGNGEMKIESIQNNYEYHCDSCDEFFDTKTALVVHRTEQSILRTRAALRESKRKATCSVKSFNEWFSEQKPKIQRRRNYKPKIKFDFTENKEVTDVVKSEEELAVDENGVGVLNNPVKKKPKLIDNGPVECNICQKVFKKKKYLNVHLAVHDSPHVCHICGAKLTSVYCLKMHIRRHNKEFTQFCSICKKGFYLRANLKIHMSVHLEHKPCVCQICHKTFGNQVYLKNHLKLHEEPSTRKKYKCEICPFETFYSYCFKEHKWTHTGEGQVTCEVCGKMIRRQTMKTHMRIHTGEKPEMCEFCGKAFSARKYLVKHRRTHTGERPYQCNVCEKRFTQRGTLTAHLRRHDLSK